MCCGIYVFKKFDELHTPADVYHDVPHSCSEDNKVSCRCWNASVTTMYSSGFSFANIVGFCMHRSKDLFYHGVTVYVLARNNCKFEIIVF